MEKWDAIPSGACTNNTPTAVVRGVILHLGLRVYGKELGFSYLNNGWEKKKKRERNPNHKY